MIRIPTIALASLLLVVSLGAGAQSPGPAAPAGNAVRGKVSFFKVGCYQCHGGEAQGSPYSTAPRLGPAALPFAAFSLFTRKPRLQMPPYSPEILSDADLADIYAYVTSRAAPVALDKLPQ
ncbi:MAG: cytochrome c [Steroidobacteraceae bacterium]